MKEPKISFTELMKELDKYREPKFNITKEQKEFVLKCRENQNPVTWTKMTELWAKLGWGEVSESAMRFRYNKIKKEDN